MSATLVDAVLRTGLSAGPRFVLVVLAHHVRDDSEPYLLSSTLISETGYSRRSLFFHLAFLERNGWIKRTARKGKSSLFSVNARALGCVYLDGQWRPVLRESVLEGSAMAARVPSLGSAMVAPSSAMAAPSSAMAAPSSAMAAPISPSYPSSYPLLINPEPEALKTLSPEPGNRRPEAGGFSEGAAKAAPPGVRSPERGRGGSTAKPSLLHVTSEPSRVRCSPEEHKARLAELRAFVCSR